MGPVPYLELFWAGPVKKDTLYINLQQHFLYSIHFLDSTHKAGGPQTYSAPGALGVTGQKAPECLVIIRRIEEMSTSKKGSFCSVHHYCHLCLKTRKRHSPGVTALQLTLQPVAEWPPEVTNTKLTVLFLLFILGGTVDFILWPPIKRKPYFPQLFSSKGVPSPSVIVRWSLRQSKNVVSMLNAVNSNDRISPCSTRIVCVFSKLLG